MDYNRFKNDLWNGLDQQQRLQNNPNYPPFQGPAPESGPPQNHYRPYHSLTHGPEVPFNPPTHPNNSMGGQQERQAFPAHGPPRDHFPQPKSQSGIRGPANAAGFGPASPGKRILIAVFGVTGTGKTTLIEKISGKSLEVGHNLKSCTRDIQEVHCNVGQFPVTLIDTPGFDDSEISDTEVLTRIAKWLQTSYTKGTLLSGIIYLHRISDLKMQGSSIKNLRMFRKLCGSDTMENVTLVTTMWSNVDPRVGERREKELYETGSFWAPMIASGSMVKRHDGTAENAQMLVLSMINQAPKAVKLQTEIASGKTLIETDAGATINEEILKVQKKHEEDLAAVRVEMELAMKQGNMMLHQEFQRHHDQVIQDIRRKAEEQQRLQDARVWELENRLQMQERESKAIQEEQRRLQEARAWELESRLQMQERESKTTQEGLKGDLESLKQELKQVGTNSKEGEDKAAELRRQLRREKARRKDLQEDHPGYNGMDSYRCSRSRLGGCGANFWAKPSKTLKCPRCGTEQSG